MGELVTWACCRYDSPTEQNKNILLLLARKGLKQVSYSSFSFAQNTRAQASHLPTKSLKEQTTGHAQG